MQYNQEVNLEKHLESREKVQFAISVFSISSTGK